MTSSKASRLRQVEAGLQAMVEVHPVVETEEVGHLVAVGGHQVEVLLVAVMVHQQVVQGPPSKPTEEGHRGAVMVALQEVVMVALQEVVMVVLQGVAVRWDQVPLRQMPRWSEASARRPGITGRMLLRNIQVGNNVDTSLTPLLINI